MSYFHYSELTCYMIGGAVMFSDPTVQEILMDITNDEKSSVSIIECMLKGKTTDEEIAEETEIRLKYCEESLVQIIRCRNSNL